MAPERDRYPCSEFGQGLGAEVAAGDLPLVVLLAQDGADQDGVRLARLVPARQEEFLDPAAVPLEPFRYREGLQPGRGRCCHCVEGGP